MGSGTVITTTGKAYDVNYQSLRPIFSGKVSYRKYRDRIVAKRVWRGVANKIVANETLVWSSQGELISSSMYQGCGLLYKWLLKKSRFQIFLVFLFIIYSNYSNADEALPQWEAGLWVGSLSIPDYRGSSETQTYVLPSPYFIYRSERIQVRGKGFKGLLYQSGNVHIDIGGKINLPVDSDKNAARAGMSDLDAVLAIGPTLHYKIYQKANYNLSFRFPVQTVFSTDIRHIEYRGFTFNPSVILSRKGQWSSRVSLAFLFATQPYNEYYYSVSENDARPGRARYQAESGYGGIRLTLITKRKFKKYSVGSFARYDNLSGATYEESPLVTKVDNVTVGLYITYQLAKSRRLVRSSLDISDE